MTRNGRTTARRNCWQAHIILFWGGAKNAEKFNMLERTVSACMDTFAVSLNELLNFYAAEGSDISENEEFYLCG